MAEDIQRFIESLVEKYGVWKVLVAPFSVIPVLAVFGIASGAPQTSLIAGGVALLEAVVLIVILASQVRKERELRLRRDAVVSRLTDAIINSKGSSYTWETWKERVTVSQDGDTIVRQWRTLRAHRGNEVGVVWAVTEQTPRGLLTPRQKRAVRVTASSWEDVRGESQPGAGYDLAEVWRDDADALAVYLSPERPVPPGKTLNVLYTWHWPGFYKHLINGGRDIVSFVRKKGTVARIELVMLFDKHCGLAGVRIRPVGGSPAPDKVVNDDGSVELRVAYGPGELPEVVGFIVDNSRVE